MKKLRNASLLATAVFLLFTIPVQAKQEQFDIIDSSSITWSDVKSMPAGAKVAILVGNPEKAEAYVARVKLPANYHIPLHYHNVNEYETVLTGKLYMTWGESDDIKKSQMIKTGSMIIVPAKILHSGWTKEETIIQISGIGPWGMIYHKNV